MLENEALPYGLGRFKSSIGFGPRAPTRDRSASRPAVRDGFAVYRQVENPVERPQDSAICGVFARTARLVTFPVSMFHNLFEGACLERSPLMHG